VCFLTNFAARIESTHAMTFEVDPPGREFRWLSVQKELKLVVPITLTRLIGDLM
jgi:hypothetical protein